LTPLEELFRILLALSLVVFLFWFGAYLETCRKRMMEKVKKKLDRMDRLNSS